MQKLNCWQFKNCGREKGGLLADVLGECPVSAALKYDGINDGRSAGRACWMIYKLAAGECSGQACHTCEFYRRVLFEQDERVCGKYSSITV